MDFFDTPTIFLSQLAQGGGGFDIKSLVPFILIFFVLYFLIIRPQNRRQKIAEMKKSAMRKGDKFMINSGILCKVDHFKEDGKVIVASLSPSVRVEIIRNMVGDVFIEVDKKGNRLDNKPVVSDSEGDAGAKKLKKKTNAFATEKTKFSSDTGVKDEKSRKK